MVNVAVKDKTGAGQHTLLTLVPVIQFADTFMTVQSHMTVHSRPMYCNVDLSFCTSQQSLMEECDIQKFILLLMPVQGRP